MARGNPVILASRSFPSQGAATAFFKEMLGRYRTGGRISDVDALDLAALLERHHEFAQKVGCGADHFSVMMTEHGTPCFRIERKDGTGTDFSYLRCITQRPPSRKQEVSQAFRRVYASIFTMPATAFLPNTKTPPPAPSLVRPPESQFRSNKATWTIVRQ